MFLFALVLHSKHHQLTPDIGLVPCWCCMMLCTACAQFNGLRIENNLQIAEKVNWLCDVCNGGIIRESLDHKLQYEHAHLVYMEQP